MNLVTLLPNSPASLRTLFDDHTSTRIGSPRHSSATSRSSATIKLGVGLQVSLIGLRARHADAHDRPQVAHSHRSPATTSGSCSQRSHSPEQPPRSRRDQVHTRASDAAQIRRPRSLNSGANARSRSPISRSSIAAPKLYAQTHNPLRYLPTEPNRIHGRRMEAPCEQLGGDLRPRRGGGTRRSSDRTQPERDVRGKRSHSFAAPSSVAARHRIPRHFTVLSHVELSRV